MSSRWKTLFAVVLVAATVALLVFGIDRYRNRYVRTNADMIALLPQGDWTVFFANFSLLRQAGILKLVAGNRGVEEPEYREFVDKTQFDYRRDIDSLTGATDGSQILFVVRGRFSWSRLRQYAMNHGGACEGELCNVPTSTGGRWASFLPIQGNVMGLAVSTDKKAAYQLSPRRERVSPVIPEQPVWVKVADSLLQHPESLPLAARIFAISLAPAESVVFSLGPSGNDEAPFMLRLDAACGTVAKADIVRGQLELETKMLKTGLSRRHEQIKRGDLTGLLASGIFQEKGKLVAGKWPVYRELLEMLR